MKELQPRIIVENQSVTEKVNTPRKLYANGKLRKPRRDFTGLKFGRLTILNRTSRKGSNGSYFYSCLCSCGNKTEVLPSNLGKKATQSCGCLRVEHIRQVIKNHTLPPEEAAINSIYGTYRHNAKSRGYSFELVKSEVLWLVKQPCHYCCAEPSNTHRNEYTGFRFSYSGLDRKNNLAGYTSANTVPCCIVCNVMKNDLGLTEFYAHLEKMFKNKDKVLAD